MGDGQFNLVGISLFLSVIGQLFATSRVYDIELSKE